MVRSLDQNQKNELFLIGRLRWRYEMLAHYPQAEMTQGKGKSLDSANNNNVSE